MTALTDNAQRALRRTLLDRQSEHRVPGVVGGVVRDGGLLWCQGVGASDLDQPDVAPDSDTQFLIASLTKTFTAVLVMRLRDEGRLSLDDTVEVFVPESKHEGITIRQMLSHATGMQREPVGDVWDTLTYPDRVQLIVGWNEAERILQPHHRWHYSNLVYSVLGEVVSRLDERPWAESLRARILGPLGMSRTTLGLEAPHAAGYYVPPYSDVPVREPVLDISAMASAGGLASTAHDLAAWASFLASPTDEVLSPDTVEEMCQPQIMADLDRWQLAWGLGLMLLRVDDRILVGHTGGMPGHVSGMFVHRPTGTGGLALMNATAAPDPAASPPTCSTTNLPSPSSGVRVPSYHRSWKGSSGGGSRRGSRSRSRCVTAYSRRAVTEPPATSRPPSSSSSPKISIAPSPDARRASCSASPAMSTASSRR
jgi:CubicO group peptidase (beta-lactamase class C family)